MQRNDSGTFRFGAYFEGELSDSAEDLASMLQDLGWLVAVHRDPLLPPARRRRRAPSIGNVADSYDNAQAEPVIGLYKRECVRHHGPFRTVDDLELVTLSWVHWFNIDRLHGSIGHVPPVEYEQVFYAPAGTAEPVL